MTYSEEKYIALLAVCNSYKNAYDSAFERLKAQQREIDGLRAENARLTEKLKQVLLAIDTVKEMNAMCDIDEQNAEIERLKADYSKLQEQFAQYQTASDKEIIAQKEEAVREFAGKLKEKYSLYDDRHILYRIIDELLKEYE